MDTGLDPRIIQKIEAFGQRRRRLILRRGVYAVVTTAVLLLSLVAFLDYFVFLEDGTRYLLTLGAYAAVGAVLWLTCIRHLLRRPDYRKLARLVETTQPELRENLLAAVELGEPLDAHHWDSEVFRAVLQDHVAARVEPVDVAVLLPDRLIGKWTRAALAAALVFVALMFVPGLRYGILFLRASMPLANIGRVSRVQIALLAPAAGDQTVPQGDPVAVTVQVSGADVGEAFLESFPENGPRGLVRMQMLDKGRFNASIQIGHESVRYRLRAGDALTRRYLLAAVARPQVLEFVKSYQYPEYVRLPEKRVTETGGDLDALEGTKVSLLLKLNQAVEIGALRCDLGGAKSDVKLEPAGPWELKATLPLTRSGTYTVHLVGAQSGFENKFSPEYELRVRADLLPSVNIEKPERDTTVEQDASVMIVGTASDDIALKSVALQYRVNQGGWQEIPVLKDPPGAEVKIQHTWDFFDLKLKPGDQVTAKLVAVDRKGNTGESPVRHFKFKFPGVDLAHLGPLGAMNEAREALGQLTRNAAALQRQTQDVFREAAAAGDDATQRKQTLSKLLPAFEETSAKAEEALGKVKDALRNVRDGQESPDLALAGRLVSRVQNEGIRGAQGRVQSAGATADAASAQAQTQQAEALVRQAAEDAAKLERDFGTLLAADEAAVAVEELRQLAGEMDQIRNLAESKANDPKLAERIKRRQELAFEHVKSAGSVLESLAAKAPPGFNDRARQAHDALIQKAPDAAAPAAQMKEGIGAALAVMEPAAAELERQARQARREMQAMAGSSAGQLQELVKAADERAAQTQANAAARAATAAKTEQQWNAVEHELRDRAALEELRKDADPKFVRDATLTAAALDQIQIVAADPAQAEAALDAVKQVARAFKTIEAGHDLGETARGLKDLAAQERWDGAAAAQAPALARQWDRLDGRLQDLEKALQNTGVAKETRDALADTAKGADVKAVRDELAARETTKKPAASLVEPLGRVEQQLAAAGQQAQPAIENARAVIAKAAPALADQLRGMAHNAAALEKGTGEIAVKVAEAPPSETRTKTRDQLEAQVAFNDRLELVRDAVRRDANAQDMSTEQGRERARDADDALAMLRQPPPKAEDLLRQAAMTPDQLVRDQALQQAQEQQAKLAKDLDLIATHYKNLDNGQERLTRNSLRRAESMLGLEKLLDKEYDKASRLAELAEQKPEALTKALEKELKHDETMRQELADIAAETVDKAATDMAGVTKQEKRLVEDLERLAQAQNPQAQALEAKAKDLAVRAAELAKKDVAALQDQQKQAGGEAQKELARASEALLNAAREMPREFGTPSPEMGKNMEAVAKTLEQSRNDLQAAQAKVEKGVQDAQQGAQQAQGELAQAQTAAQQAAAQAAAELQAARQAEEAARRNWEAAIAQAGKPGEKNTGATPEADLRRLQEQAGQIAAKAQELAWKQIPDIREKTANAGIDSRPELDRAAAKLAQVAAQMPVTFAEPTVDLGKTVDNLAKVLEQSRTDLQAAQGKVNAAVGTAEQEAKKAQENVAAAQKAAEQAQAQAQDAKAEMKKVAQALVKAAQERTAADKAADKAVAAVAANKPGAPQQLQATQQTAQQAQAQETAARQNAQSQAAKTAAAQQLAQQADKNAEAARQAADTAQQKLAEARGQGEKSGGRADQATPEKLAQATGDTAELAKQATEMAAKMQQLSRELEARDTAQQAAAAAKAAAAAAAEAQQRLTAASAPPPPAQVKPETLLAAAAKGRADRIEALGEKAKELTAQATNLARNELPALAQQAQGAGLTAKSELSQAAQALEQVASKMPTDFSKPTPEIGKQVAELAKALEQSKQQLEAAAGKTDAAAAQAQQAALKAGSDLDQAQAAAQQAEKAAAQAKAQAAQGAQAAAQAAKERAAADAALAKAKAAGAAADAQAAQQTANQAQVSETAAQQAAQQAGQAAVTKETAAQQAQQALAAAQKVAAAADTQLANIQGQKTPTAKQPGVPQRVMGAARQAGEMARDANQMAGEVQQLAREMARDNAIDQAGDKLAGAQQAAAAAQQRLAAAQGQKPAAAPAQTSPQLAQNAVRQAAEFAQQARGMADELSRLVQQNTAPLQAAAKEQGTLADQAAAAGADLARAGRHEERLGAERADALQELGEKTQATARGALTAAEQALAKSALPKQATPAAQTANSAAAARAAEAQAMAQRPGALPAETAAGQPPPNGETLDQATSRWLARALDTLDKAAVAPRSDAAPSQAPGAQLPAAPQPGGKTQPPDGQPPPGQAPNPLAPVADALNQAMQQQATTMAAARNNGQVPGETSMTPPPESLASSGGGGNRAEVKPSTDKVVAVAMDKEEWGKLPRRLAKDLMDSQQENVPAEYRAMVNSYFKVVAEKAKDKPK